MAAEWGTPPWEVSGEDLTPWRRYIWRTRYEFYSNQLAQKRNRDILREQMKHGRKG